MSTHSTNVQLDWSIRLKRGNVLGILSLGEDVVMAIQAGKQTKLKVAGAKLPVKINGELTSVCIDSGTPISISSIGKLEQTMGTAVVNLSDHKPEDNEFKDYGNNPLHLLRTMTVLLEKKPMGRRSEDQGDREQQAVDCRKGFDVESSIASDSEDTAGGECDVSPGGQQGAKMSSGETSLEQWQIYFSKQFTIFFVKLLK